MTFMDSSYIVFIIFAQGSFSVHKKIFFSSTVQQIFWPFEFLNLDFC